MAALAWIGVASRSAESIRSQRPWLLGGSVGAAYTDNGAALHQHLVEHHPGLRTYWVIDRTSPDVSRAAAIGPVLFRHATATYAYGLLAEVHVITHGVQDVPTASTRFSSAFKVRLGHGLTALKRTRPRLLHTNRSANAVYDLVPVSSEFERLIKESWGIPRDRLVVTGLPRFDTLLRKHTARLESRTRTRSPLRLLYMPTWRDWLRADGRAGLMRAIVEFLRHPVLTGALEQHDARLDVCLHIGMRDCAQTLACEVSTERVRLVNASDPQDALVAADSLITDYSSLTWDALFIDKPVLFYQFDLEEYESRRGAYFDLRADLPGAVARAPAAAAALVADHLAQVATGEFHLCDSARHWQSRLFPYRDAGNSERVTRAILERLAVRSPPHSRIPHCPAR